MRKTNKQKLNKMNTLRNRGITRRAKITTGDMFKYVSKILNSRGIEFEFIQ